MFLKFAYGNVSQIIESIFKKPWKSCMKWKLANNVSVVDESWDVASERGVCSFDWIKEHFYGYCENVLSLCSGVIQLCVQKQNSYCL